MCFHGLVQYCCFAIVVTSSLPVTGVGRLWAAVLVRCVLCVHRGAIPDGMWIVSGRGWCKLTFQGTPLKVSVLFVCYLVVGVHEWFVGAFAILCVVRGDGSCLGLCYFLRVTLSGVITDQQ